MAEVFGTIGNEQVELNNAATEATLKQLLRSTLAANKQSIESISKIAVRAGIDENTVKQTNQKISSLGQVSLQTGVAVRNLTATFQNIQQLTTGATEASDALGLLSKLVGGPLGLVLSGMSNLAKFQETLLGSYRDLTQVGVNFGGSLTDLRLAASNTYMTMDQFTKIVSQNGETLSKMGGSANEGAKAFVNLSKSINGSRVGDNLRALGFSAEQVNQGMLNYISVTGGRSRAELANVESISKGTQAYLEQLDRLADITGKNRQEQEAAHKQAMFEADVQQTMARMTKEDREAFSAAMLEAGNLYGQAGRDIVLAQAQGRAVTGEAGKMLMATAPAAATAISSLQSTAKQFGSSSREFADVSNKSVLETQKAFKGIDPVIFSVNKQFGFLRDSARTAAQAEMSGLTTQQAMDERENQRAIERDKRITSEAAAAAETQKKLNELGQAILERVMPAFQNLLMVFNPMIQSVTDFLTTMVKIPGVLEGLLAVVGALTVAFVAYKTHLSVKAAKSIGRGTAANPMFVRDVGSGVGGLGGKESPTGKLGKFGKLAGGVGGVLGGLALGAAADYATESGYEKTGAGLDIGSSALTGAGIGAFLGPAGALIGGGLGAAYGAYQNWGTLFGGKGRAVPSPATESAVPAAIEPAEAAAPVTETETPAEKMIKQLERLNSQTSELIRYMRETSEHARRTVDVTRALSGNMFPVP